MNYVAEVVAIATDEVKLTGEKDSKGGFIMLLIGSPKSENRIHAVLPKDQAVALRDQLNTLLGR